MFCLDSVDVTFSVEIYMRVNNIVPKHFSVMIWLLSFDKITSENLSTEQTGYFFRTDRESLGKQNYIALNMDISLWGNEITPIAPFIKKIDEFDIIHTDRLHVAILACLLHKRVHFYKGGYFKNEAVFRSSMKDYFDDVFLA